jgi:hypothetical protein
VVGGIFYFPGLRKFKQGSASLYAKPGFITVNKRHAKQPGIKGLLIGSIIAEQVYFFETHRSVKLSTANFCEILQNKCRKGIIMSYLYQSQ